MKNLQGIISRSVNNASMQLERLGTVANTSSNYLTDGYKSVRFENFLQEDGRINGVERVDYRQGSISSTGRELDMAINGTGFIPVTTPNGQIAYTRNCSFKTNEEGLLVMADGSVVGEGIKIPAATTQVFIKPDGRVLAADENNLQGNEVGKIQLVKFNNYEGLQLIDNNKVVATKESGEPVLITEHKQFTQGCVERSNVNIRDSINDILRLNASLVSSTRIIKFTDEIYQKAINLTQ
ncbi:MAG: flagellar hook basal-body protein [Candidatus Gastranaerophilales bacterium]|nr:flagellar hook basal-body protein [Candidatus Gastranaerophilales bacterium]